MLISGTRATAVRLCAKKSADHVQARLLPREGKIVLAASAVVVEQSRSALPRPRYHRHRPFEIANGKSSAARPSRWLLDAIDVYIKSIAGLIFIPFPFIAAEIG